MTVHELIEKLRQIPNQEKKTVDIDGWEIKHVVDTYTAVVIVGEKDAS